mmetsp:Transcript_19039/g.37366  ORF Transcript_19039/g.37366 Transcript_19039/m.37366 type:complete len:677 (+) Transcript_19039:52-2082(+)
MQERGGRTAGAAEAGMQKKLAALDDRQIQTHRGHTARSRLPQAHAETSTLSGLASIRLAGGALEEHQEEPVLEDAGSGPGVADGCETPPLTTTMPTRKSSKRLLRASSSKRMEKAGGTQVVPQPQIASTSTASTPYPHQHYGQDWDDDCGNKTTNSSFSSSFSTSSANQNLHDDTEWSGAKKTAPAPSGVSPLNGARPVFRSPSWTPDTANALDALLCGEKIKCIQGEDSNSGKKRSGKGSAHTDDAEGSKKPSFMTGGSGKQLLRTLSSLSTTGIANAGFGKRNSGKFASSSNINTSSSRSTKAGNTEAQELSAAANTENDFEVGQSASSKLDKQTKRPTVHGSLLRGRSGLLRRSGSFRNANKTYKRERNSITLGLRNRITGLSRKDSRSKAEAAATTGATSDGEDIDKEDDDDEVSRDPLASMKAAEKQHCCKIKFQHILENSDISKALLAFVEAEFASENVLFLQATHRFRNQFSRWSPAQRKAEALKIYQKFIKSEAQHWVCSCKSFENVLTDKLDNGHITLNMFGDMEAFLIKELRMDVFPRFLDALFPSCDWQRARLINMRSRKFWNLTAAREVLVAYASTMEKCPTRAGVRTGINKPRPPPLTVLPKAQFASSDHDHDDDDDDDEIDNELVTAVQHLDSEILSPVPALMADPLPSVSPPAPPPSPTHS